MTNALFLAVGAIYLCCIVLCLCTFAMAVWTLVETNNNKVELANIKQQCRIITGQFEFLSSNNLEPGMYVPKTESVTGEVTYQKVSDKKQMEQWLANNNRETDTLLQEMLEITGERRG